MKRTYVITITDPDGEAMFAAEAQAERIENQLNRMSEYGRIEVDIEEVEMTNAR